MKNRSLFFRHIFLSFLLIICIIAGTVFLSGCNKKEPETFSFRLAHFFPPTHPAETILIKGWIEAVKTATDGRVTIESFPGETLSKAADIYDGVVSGIADIGLSCFIYTPGRFPVLESFEQPGIVYNNSKVASMVAWEGIQTLAPAEVQDTKLLMVIATGPGDLFTKTPVNSLADLSGMEIRATGISADTITHLGGIPVGMPQSETYDALSRGVVSGNLAPIEVLKGWRHAEVTKYITKTPFLYNTLFFVTMNKSKWESMPEDLREKILEVTAEFHEQTAIGLWDMQNQEAEKFAIEENNMQQIDLSEAEKAIWIQKVSPIQENYKNKLAGLGIDSDPLALINELADKYNEIYK